MMVETKLQQTSFSRALQTSRPLPQLYERKKHRGLDR